MQGLLYLSLHMNELTHSFTSPSYCNMDPIPISRETKKATKSRVLWCFAAGPIKHGSTPGVRRYQQIHSTVNLDTFTGSFCSDKKKVSENDLIAVNQ